MSQHKLEGKYNFQPVMSISSIIMVLVHSKESSPDAERLPEHLNTMADQESQSIRDCYDWMLNHSVFHQILTQMGPLEIDLFASPLLQLEARSGSRSHGCIPLGLVTSPRFCQSTLLPDSALPNQSERTVSMNSVSDTFLENSAMVPGSPRGSLPGCYHNYQI